jgi:hypothetical protein
MKPINFSYHLVKQLTEGYYCITEWRRSGFTWLLAPDEQSKLKRLTLNSLLSKAPGQCR